MSSSGDSQQHSYEHVSAPPPEGAAAAAAHGVSAPPSGHAHQAAAANPGSVRVPGGRLLPASLPDVRTEPAAATASAVPDLDTRKFEK